MPLSTYTELQASIADWMDRDDLETQIRDFIRMSEAEFNRTLFIPEREEISTSTMTGASLSLPLDFWGVRSFYLDSDPQVLLEQASPGLLRAKYGNLTGKPINFALQGTEILFGPSPDSEYAVVMNYWKTIPALSDDQPSNWLLETYPDLYLYNSLLKGSAFAIDKDAIGIWQQQMQLAHAEAQQVGLDKAYGATPLRVLQAPQVV